MSSEDHSFPGKDILIGVTVRSTIAFGKILSVSLPDLPDGYHVISAEDIPGENELKLFSESIPYLAAGQVRYIGEPILLVAGPDREISKEIADLVTITYKELPAHFAMGEENCWKQQEYRNGDPDRVIRTARRILRGEYTTDLGPHVFARPLAVNSSWNSQGNLIVHSKSIYLHHSVGSIARCLGLPRKKVRVISLFEESAVGCEFFSTTLLAGHASLITCLTKKQARMTLDWQEYNKYAPGRFPAHIRHSTAIDDEGKPLAMDIEISINSGAYPILSPEAAVRCALAACGSYSCENVRIKTKLYTTNQTPPGGIEGLGEPQAFFAAELHANKIAQSVGLDPYTWKKKHLIHEGSVHTLSTKTETDDRGLRVLEDVVYRSDFPRRYASYRINQKNSADLLLSRAPHRGIGLSISFHGIGLPSQYENRLPSGIRVRLDSKGKFHLLTSHSAEKRRDFYQSIVHKNLRLSRKKIELSNMDSFLVPDTGPDLCSRGSFIIGSLLEKACQTIDRKLQKTPPPIEISRSYKPTNVWDPVSLKGDPYPALCWEATVVEIEMDPVTLEPICKGIWITLDIGGQLDLETASVEVEVSALKELEYIQTPTEHMAYEKKYSPPVRLNFLNNDETEVSKEAKNIGNNAILGIAPAFISAVWLATGHEFTHIPITPESIQEVFTRENPGGFHP